MKLLVNGAERLCDVPGLAAVERHCSIAFAPDEAALARELPGTDILLGWNFRGRQLEANWHHADQLKWIHWCGAGVDAVLFPALTQSDVVLTNSRGIFDRAMAEYVLGYMLLEVKGMRETLRFQAEKTWDFRMTEKLSGSRAMIYGVGSIGREIARVLKANDVDVSGVGRSARTGDADFDDIQSFASAARLLPEMDWVIGILPLTDDTQGVFDRAFFQSMSPSARFINVGRGPSVVEEDLVAALRNEKLAGALLDVFVEEPVTEDSALWDTPNLVVSPHMSGDYSMAPNDMVQLFLQNLESFAADQPLANVVDKALGFVR